MQPIQGIGMAEILIIAACLCVGVLVVVGIGVGGYLLGKRSAEKDGPVE